jgi:hypothetical protein
LEIKALERKRKKEKLKKRKENDSHGKENVESKQDDSRQRQMTTETKFMNGFHEGQKHEGEENYIYESELMETTTNANQKILLENSLDDVDTQVRNKEFHVAFFKNVLSKH